MTRQKPVTRMREQVDAAAALGIVESLAGTSSPAFERRVYYPYYWFRVNGRTRTLFGRHAISTSCLIDGRNGMGATADPFEVETSLVAADDVLTLRASAADADRAARRVVSHSLGRRFRMLADFGITTRALGLIYKAFWLVRVDELTVLVDSMTGSVHPLPADSGVR